MVISQGEIWWADLPEPSGSAPAYRRPVLVVQADAFNRSAIGTVVCVTMTSNLKWADSPGNVRLRARDTGLTRDSVVNATQLLTLDKRFLTERVGKVDARRLELVLSGLDILMGR